MTDGIPHGTSSGYTTHKCRCEECRAYKRQKSAEYYQRERDRVLTRNKAYYMANREKELAAAKRRHQAKPEIGRAAMARWREKNPDAWKRRDPTKTRERDRRYQSTPKAKAYQRAWRLANKERSAVYSVRWAAKNPVKAHIRSHRNQMVRLFIETKVVTERDWLRLCARYGNCCAYCGEVVPLTQEHVVPLTRGGRHSIGNLLPACQSCNSSKNNRFLVEWRAALTR